MQTCSCFNSITVETVCSWATFLEPHSMTKGHTYLLAWSLIYSIWPTCPGIVRSTVDGVIGDPRAEGSSISPGKTAISSFIQTDPETVVEHQRKDKIRDNWYMVKEIPNNASWFINLWICWVLQQLIPFFISMKMLIQCFSAIKEVYIFLKRMS